MLFIGDLGMIVAKEFSLAEEQLLDLRFVDTKDGQRKAEQMILPLKLQNTENYVLSES